MPLYPTISSDYLVYGPDGFPLIGDPEQSIVEDFESQSLSDYADDTDAFRIQGNNVLQGRYSLESTIAQRTIGAGTNRPTPRGTDSNPIEYRCRMVLADDGQASLLTNVQAANAPWSNSYVLLVDTPNDRIRLLRREAGATVNHEYTPVSGGLSTGTEYRPAITLSEQGIKGTLYSSAGNVLAETDPYADETFTGGGLGWHNGVGQTAYYDYTTSNPGQIGDLTADVVEDFESGNLSGYWIRNTSGSASVSPTAAYEGSYGLDMNGFSEVQTTPGGGRPGYIRDGVPVQFNINFRTIGSQQYWIPFCPSARNSRNTRYLLQHTMGGGFRFRKVYSDGSMATLSGDSSEGRDYAALYNVSYSSGVWYGVVLEADSSNGLYAALYNSSGSRVGWISSPETAFVDAENGYGAYCSGGGRVFIDNLHETER